MHAVLNPRDEIEFPGAALDLPGTERHEQHKEQNGDRAGDHQEQRGAAPPGARFARRVHGMLCMFIIESGIIL